MLERLSFGKLPLVGPDQRLLPERPAGTSKGRFAAILALCLLFHAALLGAFLFRNADELEAPPAEEIPIEVIVEPPPPPPPPPEEPKPEEKKQKAEQPKPKYEQSIKPAFDAPRAQNEEKVEREAPDEQTHAPTQQAQPVERAPAEQAAQEDTPKIADTPAPSRQEMMSQPTPDEDKPDAEALAKAELQNKKDIKKMNSEAAKTKKPLPIDQKSAMAKQLAALTPTPNFTFGSMSKAAPVTGGTENTTYLSVLFGIIMKHMNNPQAARGTGGTAVIFFALDDNGNLVHQAVERTSGYPDIDAETMAAVKRSAPFPPPPRDLPHRFFFSRDIDRGR